MKFRFIIKGEPYQYRTQARQIRLKRSGKMTILVFPVTHSRQWQTEVMKQIAVQKNNAYMDYEFPLNLGPTILRAWIFRTRPKSVKTMFPDKKPDWDNLIKCAQDAFDHNVIKNDSQIVSAVVHKRWAGIDYADCGTNDPGMIIELEGLDKCGSAEQLNLLNTESVSAGKRLK